MAASVRTAIDEARASAVPSTGTRPTVGVVLALGRIEARKMLRHPAFLLSIAFGLLLFRGAIGVGGSSGIELNVAWLAGGVSIGILIGALLTTNVATMRPRRDHLSELYGSLPAPAEARTAGVLAGLLLGLGGLAIIVAGASWLVLGGVDEIADYVDLFLASQYVLSVLALGSVGVAVGRWIPSVLGGPLVVIAHVFTGLIWIVPWIAPTSTGIDVDWHLTYLVAVIAGCAALAFARDRRTPVRFLLVVAAFGLAVLAGVQQTPPGGY